MKYNDETAKIELLRGGAVVSSLAGSFGSGLRETRLTALLGYLIALEPEVFCQKFNFPGKPLSVALEQHHETDRSDILIKTTSGTGVIEAKITRHDPYKQSLKYPADWRVSLTEYCPTRSEKARNSNLYLRWSNLEELFFRLSTSPRTEVRFVSRDLHRYLQEHRMIRKPESIEVYAREINEANTLALFLKGRMYACNYQASSPLPEAMYFAPHFGQTIADDYPGVHVGISYIAQIESVEVVESFEDLLETASAVRGRPWLKAHKHLIDPLAAWEWTDCRRSILFLKTPRLVFNPPVKKEKLQKGKGWLSKRVFSFDMLFEAWKR